MNQKTKNTMTLGEFRRMFGVPARTLRYWISTGRIRVLKIDNGRGGFSKRIRRLETLADWVALENAFAKRPARGPCPRLPLPKDKAFRAAVRGFASIMQEKGEAYRTRGKPLVAQWRATLAAYKVSDAETARAIREKSKTIPL
jgi:hypothetical protein